MLSDYRWKECLVLRNCYMRNTCALTWDRWHAQQTSVCQYELRRMCASAVSMTNMPSQVHVFPLNKRMCVCFCSFCVCARMRVQVRMSIYNYNSVNVLYYNIKRRNTRMKQHHWSDVLGKISTIEVTSNFLRASLEEACPHTHPHKT